MPHFIIFYLCSLEGNMVPDPNAPDAHEVEAYQWLTKEELQILPMFDDCRAGVLSL